MMCGGHSAEKPADPEIQTLVNNLKSQIESQLNSAFTVFNVKSYTSQVVAGTNYTIKIDVDGGKMVVAKVFKPLPCNSPNPELKDCVFQ